jgi:hypothetical protein
MTSWLNRLGHWLVVRPWWVWVTIVVVVGILMIRCRLSLTGEASLRITGLAFQLFGLGTVAIGLHKTRQLFKHPGLLALIKQWLRDVPRLASQRSIPVSQSATIGISTRLTIAIPSIEERVAVLERRFAEDSHLRGEAIASEGRSREAADQELRKQLEEYAAGGLNLETIGLCWIFLGIILATISVEIDTLYKSIFNYKLCLF